MTHMEPQETDRADCPKRVWVMATLSDDELCGEGQSVPQGLRFHLSRCESCRLLSERILRVTDSLRDLGGGVPPEGLAGLADVQAGEALRAGARLTGRVDVPEDMELELGVARVSVWRRYGQYAAAAMILLAVGLVWAFTRQTGYEDSGVERPVGITARSPQPVPPKGVEAAGVGVATPVPAAPDLASADAEPDVADRAEEDVEGYVAASPGSRLDLTVPPANLEGHYHHSYIEAALCEDPVCVRRAHLLPDLKGRVIGSGPAFDTSIPVDSTNESTWLLGGE